MNQSGGIIVVMMIVILAIAFVIAGFLLGGYRVEVEATVSIDFGANWQCVVGEIHQYEDNSVLGFYWPWDTWSVNVHGTLYGDLGETYEDYSRSYYNK